MYMTKIYAYILICISMLLFGCTIKEEQIEISPKEEPKDLYSCNSFLVYEKETQISDSEIETKDQNNKLKKIFADFDRDIPIENTQFKNRLNYLKTHPKHVASVLNNARPYIQAVYDEIKAHNLPAEIVIIPMIESMYNPKAQSKDGPAGMWQFTVQTARNFGLKVGNGVDERKDPQKATKAAVKYLSYLSKMVDGSLDVMVAAYNAGEGRVKRLYNASNGEKANRHQNYNNVKMPDFTRSYLDHMFAYSYYLQHIDFNSFKMLPIKTKKKVTKRSWVSQHDFAKHHNRTIYELNHQEKYITRTEYDGRVFCAVEFTKDNKNLQALKDQKAKLQHENKKDLQNTTAEKKSTEAKQHVKATKTKKEASKTSNTKVNKKPMSKPQNTKVSKKTITKTRNTKVTKKPITKTGNTKVSKKSATKTENTKVSKKPISKTSSTQANKKSNNSTSKNISTNQKKVQDQVTTSSKTSSTKSK